MAKKLSIVIPSCTELVGPIISFFHALFKDKDVEEPIVSNVITAVIEAVANAIKHGNNADTSKQIAISVCIHKNTLKIVVRDEGDGFDAANLPDPLTSENLFKPSGRGIFLIKSFMDTVEFDFQGKGTRLMMEKVFDRNIE